MTIILVILSLSLAAASKLDRTYLPPPESKVNIDSYNVVEDYLVSGEIQSSFPESTDRSALGYTSPSLFVSDIESRTTYDDHMRSEKTEEFKTETPTNHLKELSTPFFYNRFQVPEELLTNQSNEIIQGIINERVEDCKKQNYGIKSNENVSHVFDINDYNLSNSSMNQIIDLSLPGTDLQPQVQMSHLKSKTYANILPNNMVMVTDGNNILSTTENIQVYNSTPLNFDTLLNPQIAIKASIDRVSPNNSIDTGPRQPQTEGDSSAYILNYKNDVKSNTLSYSYDTSNGIHANQNGTAAGGVRVQGSYSYTGDDGKLYVVDYSADENGFQPRGDHLPTPPPIPEAILKVIVLAAKDEEQGIFDDGSYDVKKYGDDKYHYDYRSHHPSNENTVVVNGVDLPPENALSNYSEENVNLHRSGGENELTTLRGSNVSSEDSKQYVLNGEVNKEKVDYGLGSNSPSQPIIMNSLFKILPIIDNNEVNKNKGDNVNVINEAESSNHDDNGITKTRPYISEIAERKEYHYERPQKDFETPTTEEALVNIAYGSSANGDINNTMSNNENIEVFMTSNVIRDYQNIKEVKKLHFIEFEQMNHKSDNKKLLKINDKNYDNSFSFNKDFENYYPSSLAQQVPGNDVYMKMGKNFLPATTNDLLQKLHVINTAKTENYDNLPNSTPFGDDISLNIETTESSTTSPSIGTDESTNNTNLSLPQNSDTYKNLISKTSRPILSHPALNREEEHIGYPILDTISYIDGTDTELEPNTSEYNKPASSIFVGLPTKPTLPYYKNYVTKSPYVKIIGENFTGPKQPTKYDPNSGYYY